MDKYLKRKGLSPSEDVETNKKRKLEECPHKTGCYRRNPHHFKEYEHSHLMNLIASKNEPPKDWPQDQKVYKDQIDILNKILKVNTGAQPSTSRESTKNESKTNSEIISSIVGAFQKSTTIKSNTKGNMLQKWENTCPYNIFYTVIPKSPKTLEGFNTIRFTDLLCPSLGVLKSSLQINFMIDIGWLMEQYKEKNVHTNPITIIYGSQDFPDMEKYMDLFLKHCTYHYVKMKDPFGTHHSKVGIYQYEDGSIRVVVSTANLYYEDWNHYNQGLWISPKCQKMSTPSDDEGESPTGFKQSLISYLETYKIGCLKEWVEVVRFCDFSQIKVFLVTSVPGKHYPNNGSGCHLHRVADLLKRHCVLPTKTTPESEGPLSWGVLAQASSIGSLGKNPSDWFRSTLLRSLSAHTGSTLTSSSNASLSMVYPSVDNVMRGYFGAESGGCLPYSKKTNEQQKWFQNYLYQWKADLLERTRAMPHIKTYCRVSPCLSKLAYFLLTSSNLSKSAWGGNLQKDQGIYVRSYEVGVMFLPTFFGDEYFEIQNTANRKNKALFPFMYDLPLTGYQASDYPWCN